MADNQANTPGEDFALVRRALEATLEYATALKLAPAHEAMQKALAALARIERRAIDIE